MSDSEAGPSIIAIFAGSLGFILCAVCILGFFVAGFAIDYIDERIEEDCESTTGQVGQMVGADEGQCDEVDSTCRFHIDISTELIVIYDLTSVIGLITHNDKVCDTTASLNISQIWINHRLEVVSCKLIVKLKEYGTRSNFYGLLNREE